MNKYVLIDRYYNFNSPRTIEQQKPNTTMVPFFSDPFFSAPMTDYKLDDVKEIGFVVDWFSKVYGRTLLVGTTVYETHKNYRCKTEFEQYKVDSAMDVPTVIFIHEFDKENILKFKTVDNLFTNKLDDIKHIENKIFCTIRPPKLKKNGKLNKDYDIERKKRFTIPVENVMMSADMRVVKSTTISCTFRNLI